MRVVFLIFSLLLANLSFANEEILKEKISKLKLLQDRVSKECINNPNAKNYSVYIDGKKLNCPELLSSTDLLRKKLAEDIEKHKLECVENNKKAAHDTLAKQAANIVQKSASCEPSQDREQCLGKFSCGVLTVAVPVSAIAARLTKNPAVKECVAQAKGMPGCLANVLRGIFDSIWSAVTLVWDLGKLAMTSVGEWMGIVKKSEAQTSEKAMMAQQASPGFIKTFVANPIDTMKKMAKELYASLEAAAINHYGCEKWSGAPFVSSCLRPMSTWKCGTCQQKAQVYCGIAGYAIGEIGTAFLTGGLTAGGKIALKGALRIGSGPAKNVTSFMGKTFPKAAVEVSEAGAKLKALASAGFTTSQKKLFSAWDAVANSQMTKAIGTAAKMSGVSVVAKTALKPVSMYLSAMEKAFVAGGNTVEGLSKGAKAQLGSKIADEAMGVNSGLVVESTPEGAKAVAASKPTISPAVRAEVSPVSVTSQVKSEAEASVKSSKVAKSSDELSDMAKYRQDPEYMELFKGPQMYDDHHKELSLVIKALEEAQPRLSKAEIRKKIKETLNSCSL
jgi:hypothetical protein